MTDGLQVSTQVLRGSGARLRGQAETLAGFGDVSVTPRSARYGHPALQRAAGQLAERWGLGLSNLSADVRTCGVALEQVADAFEQVDSAAAGAARNLAR